MSGPGSPLLEVEHLTMPFGGLVAVNDLSFEARLGDITTIIGPNGAGKTTLFNCLTGFYRAPVGRMQLHADGRKKPFLLERMEDFHIARDARIIRTFQNVRLFAGMSVLENVIVAQHADIARAASVVGAFLSLPRYRKAMNRALERARFWLHRLGLLHVADQTAGALPYGLQRRLELARALCARPRLLCLDEPAAGLNPRESQELNALLIALKREHGLSILLIEHDMSVVMQVSDWVIVLDHGVRIAQGTPAQIREDPAVIRAYLGSSELADVVPRVGAAC